MANPKVVQKGAMVLEMQPGNYAWCACGESKNQPFCDGSHKGTEFRPVLEKIDQSRKIAWCGCKHSAKKPFCDGSHKRLD